MGEIECEVGERLGTRLDFFINFLVLLFLVELIEQLLTECRKTKTKVITLTNPTDTDNPMNQSKLEANTFGYRQAREKECELVTIDFKKVAQDFLANHKA